MIDRKDKLITKLFIEICSVPYHFRLYLGGQKGRTHTLSLVIKMLAQTGMILSLYLRNRNFVLVICSVAYYFRCFLRGQMGTHAVLLWMLKMLAQTGTILSLYLGNCNNSLSKCVEFCRDLESHVLLSLEVSK